MQVQRDLSVANDFGLAAGYVDPIAAGYGPYGPVGPVGPVGGVGVVGGYDTDFLINDEIDDDTDLLDLVELLDLFP